MRTRTAVALAVVVAALLGAAGLAVAGDGGRLEVEWTSDTGRANVVNHHAVAVEGELIVAPVAGRPNVDVMRADTCSLARLDPGTGATQWRFSVAPANCTSHALTEPALGDLTGDGSPEVVVATGERELVALSAEGRVRWRVDTSAFGYPRPTVADVDADGRPEAITVDNAGQVTVVDADGTVVWRRATDWTTFTAPVVADVDADGDSEVAVGTFDGTVILSAAGGIERRLDAVAVDLVVENLDEDAALELVTTDVGSVRAIDGATGRVEWTTDLAGTPTLETVADGDGDGRPEAYLGYAGSRVGALDATTGAIKWTTRLATDSRRSAPAPVLGDVSGDGTPELVVATPTGAVVVLDPDGGTELARYERDVPLWTFPTVADAGDGQTAVFARYGDGRVVRLTYVERGWFPVAAATVALKG